jgi:NTP pyrophosphatase (non-canonical NTP hydrolase)
MDLNDFQREANRTDQRPGNEEGALLFPVIGLSSEIGSLVRHVKKRLRDGDAHELFSDEMAEELGDVLWYVANLAEKLGLDLDEVARRNLRKVAGRWPMSGETLPLLLPDADFPEGERLPRQTSVTFTESEEDGRLRVRLYGPDGQKLGDPLTDNAYDDDGYRFHDVFHLTYAALLGWSPITRFFFSVKRDSDPKVREVEDGGRASVIEEAVSAFVFDYARDAHYLEGVEHLDFSLLSTIGRLVSRLEVRDRSAYEWERAILRSFEVWRPLHRSRGGTVHLDLQARTIELE